MELKDAKLCWENVLHRLQEGELEFEKSGDWPRQTVVVSEFLGATSIAIEALLEAVIDQDKRIKANYYLIEELAKKVNMIHEALLQIKIVDGRLVLPGL